MKSIVILETLPVAFLTSISQNTGDKETARNFATEPMLPAWVRKRIQSVFGRRQADDILEGYEPMIMRVDKDGSVNLESLNNRVWRDEDQ